MDGKWAGRVGERSMFLGIDQVQTLLRIFQWIYSIQYGFWTIGNDLRKLKKVCKELKPGGHDDPWFLPNFANVLEISPCSGYRPLRLTGHFVPPETFFTPTRSNNHSLTYLTHAVCGAKQ